MDQAEQLRNIIKKQNMQQHLARVITVTSGKGGVGKSNVSVNLALQLSRLNKKSCNSGCGFWACQCGDPDGNTT